MSVVDFLEPPNLRTEEGNVRRVGIEIEFAGVSVDDAALVVKQTFGGEIVRENPFLMSVKATRFGDFGVELDSSLLKEQRYRDYMGSLGIDPLGDFGDAIESAIQDLAPTLVPSEIVSPPIPITELAATEQLRSALRLKNAEGTKASPLYAFGLHLNPELPAKTVESLLAHLRAFFLLYPWIVEDSEIDLSRRVTPYINPFPEDYVRFVLDASYHPSLSDLIDDYLEHNPTRNRPLDMLPAFFHIDRDRVREHLGEEELIKPRPTFHYRLPNCRIDEPNWSFATPWNRWVEVERLAAHSPRLSDLATKYLQTSTVLTKATWIEEVRSSLNLA